MLIEEILNKVSYAIWSLTSLFTAINIPNENITITYTLYTPENQEPTIINNIDELTINPDYELKILCHGWHYGNYSTQWYNYTVEEYMKKGGVNVITANYAYVLNSTKYYEAFKYANHIGSQVGDFILKLKEMKGIKFSKLHILGHLLGAHIAGVAGETVYKETGRYIDRITGLDPNNAGFMYFQADGRLSRNDATFVDAIHASTASDYQTLGRIDFYGYPYTSKCAYNWRNAKHMAPIYYTRSINNLDNVVCTKCLKMKFYFSSTQCNDNVTSVLGEYVDREQFGKFVLKESDISRYVCESQTIETTTTTTDVTEE